MRYIVLFLMLAAVGMGALSGTGDSAGDPYLIANTDDWVEFVSDSTYWAAGKFVQLTSSIDFTAISPIDPVDIATGSFDATFDGNNKTLSEFTITPVIDATNHNALFEKLGATAIIQDLTITNATIVGDTTQAGQSYCGILAGEVVYGAVITGCSIVNPTLTITHTQAGQASYVGAMVGANHGTVTSCSVIGGTISGDISAGTKMELGGVVGLQTGGSEVAQAGSSSNCTSSATVRDVDGDSAIIIYVGGLAGNISYNGVNSVAHLLTNSTFTGTVNYTSVSEVVAGQISGMVLGTITGCNSSGNLLLTTTEAATSSFLGGIVGEGHSSGTGIIASCKSTGNITISAVKGCRTGGIAGYFAGAISNSSYNGTITTVSTGTGARVGGLVGWLRTTETVDDSFAIVALDIDSPSTYAGGGIGQADASSVTSNCYARGTVYDNNADNTTLAFSVWGGFAGYGATATYINCYTAIGPWGGASGNREGFIGLNTTCTLTDDYWDTDVAGHTTAADATEATTAQLQTQSYYAAGWDFNSTGGRNWKMDASGMYPLLDWEVWNTGGSGVAFTPIMSNVYQETYKGLYGN